MRRTWEREQVVWQLEKNHQIQAHPSNYPTFLGKVLLEKKKKRTEKKKSLPGNWTEAWTMSWCTCSWIGSEALACGRVARVGAEATVTINMVNLARSLSTQVTARDPTCLGFDWRATSRKSFLKLKSLSMKSALTVKNATACVVSVGDKLGAAHSPREEKVLRTADAWPSTISKCRASVTNLISMSAEFWSALRQVEF